MPFPKPNRAMLFDSAGLACYIAWSFVFWNGSVLFGDLRHEAPVGEAQIVQAALTALAALVLVLLARRTAPLRRRTVLLAVFAAVSSLAIVVAALAGFGRAPMGWMLIAFALSGLGSTLRLGWEERMSVQGVERTAVCAGTAYLLGFLLFALISLLPALSVLAVSVLLPFGAFGLLAIAVRANGNGAHQRCGCCPLLWTATVCAYRCRAFLGSRWRLFRSRSSATGRRGRTA